MQLALTHRSTTAPSPREQRNDASAWPAERERAVNERVSAWKNGVSMIEAGICGQWIETRDQQTDDGHLVGIRIDVTERRAAEEALSAR